MFPEVTDASEELLHMPSDVSEESKSLLERFVVLMYDRASDIMEMNDASKKLFAHKSGALDNIPPTQAAHQACISPGQLLEPNSGPESRVTKPI